MSTNTGVLAALGIGLAVLFGYAGASRAQPNPVTAIDIALEPFAAFTFAPAGASVYQLGSFGTARKELRALVVTP